MNEPLDSRHPLIGLVDETTRLGARLKSVFSGSRQLVGLGDAEMVVLNSVVEADRSPTVAQIARSLGHARQLVQRAANSLVEGGLIETVANPDHKRSPLLKATEKGNALKRKADDRAEQIAEKLAPAIELGNVRDATVALRTIRRQLEELLRAH